MQCLDYICFFPAFCNKDNLPCLQDWLQTHRYPTKGNRFMDLFFSRTFQVASPRGTSCTTEESVEPGTFTSIVEQSTAMLPASQYPQTTALGDRDTQAGDADCINTLGMG